MALLFPIYSISVSCITLLCDGLRVDGFQKDDIPKRMQASAISARRQSLEGLLAMFVMGGGLWGIGMAGAILMYGKTFLSSENFGYYVLNTLASIKSSTFLAFETSLITFLIRSSNSPRYFDLATSPDISRETSLFQKNIRNIATDYILCKSLYYSGLATPGSPIRHGLFCLGGKVSG